MIDFTLFPELRDGPLRSGLFVAASIAIACLATLLLHRMGIALLRRLARSQPFAANAIDFGCRPTRACALLLAIRIVLTGAPDNTPALVPLAHLCSVALILAITWLIIRCIESISFTIVQINPVNTADNLKARQVLTQTRVLTRSANAIVGVLGLASVLMTLPGAKQIGTSLLASAGVAGLVAGMAARPVLTNFFAGLQIAFSQPIRMDDVLIVKGEWGRVEEITGTFVVVRIWDERRLIVPLQWFIENPFENWTHTSSTILGTVFMWLDFGVPVAAIRAEFERVTKASVRWDGRVCVLHVHESNERALQIRLLVSAQDSGTAYDLRAELREAMHAFVAANYPGSLPRLRSDDRIEVSTSAGDGPGPDGIIDGSPYHLAAAPASKAVPDSPHP